MARGLVVNRNVGMLLLGVWLLLTGLSAFGIALPSMLMAVLALLAGILIIAGR